MQNVYVPFVTPQLSARIFSLFKRFFIYSGIGVPTDHMTIEARSLKSRAKYQYLLMAKNVSDVGQHVQEERTLLEDVCVTST